MIFTTTTFGKWILSGEQSVLRGHPALVFPLGNYQLQLTYTPTDNPLEIISSHDFIVPIQRAWQLGWSQCAPLHPMANTGYLRIHSSIPIGQGMGASAAMCLAIARCILHYSTHAIEPWLLAREMEHLFHGQSSGLDIIGAGSTQGTWFQNGTQRPLDLKWRPQWMLTKSNEIGMTSKAIAQVQALWQQQPDWAQEIDHRMETSVNLLMQALESPHALIDDLATGMKLANDCFKDWGLITPHMQLISDELYKRGALAVKPTGSGGGGYLLSLWNHSIPSSTEDIAIILPDYNMSLPA
jgi:mevalonate kinase